ICLPSHPRWQVMSQHLVAARLICRQKTNLTSMIEPAEETTVEPASRPRLVRRIGQFLGSHWFRAAILFSCAIVIHFPALTGEMIWDDDYLAKANPFIKSPLLSVEAFRHHLYLDSHSEHYRPVQNLSMMVDYFFWSDNPYGFHLSNV